MELLTEIKEILHIGFI